MDVCVAQQVWSLIFAYDCQFRSDVAAVSEVVARASLNGYDEAVLWEEFIATQTCRHIGPRRRGLFPSHGVRESTQSWREVLLALKSRGMNAPKLAIGDGAMGFWAALEEVFPITRQQRCWMHKTMNVLNCLPKLSQPKAKDTHNRR